MKFDECEHCKNWVRYNESRFECARVLGGFDCAFVSRDGQKPKTYAELEKENAELKEKLEIEENARGDWFGKAVTKDRRLTEAKEIIKYLCSMVRELNKPNVQLTNIDYSLSEAEQFLKGGGK